MVDIPPRLDRALQGRGGEPPAFICGLGSNGLSFVRSLGRRRIPVVSMDTWSRPDMVSRYSIPWIVPDPTDREDTLLKLMDAVAKIQRQRGVLIPTNDAFVLFLSKYRTELSDHFDLNVADHGTVNTLLNKRLQYEFAERTGVSIPRTWYPEDVGIRTIAREVSYPCIIKPYSSHLWESFMQRTGELRWGKVGVAGSAAELIATFEAMAASGLGFMVQEKISGGPETLYDILVYLNRDSVPLASFTKHKIRIYPLDFGVSSVAIGEWLPDVAELGLRFVRALRYRGAVSPEFKRDPRDGQLKLMEVNARSILTTHLAVVSGVDIPYIIYQDSRGHALDPAPRVRSGITWISFQRDLRALVEVRRRGNVDLSEWMGAWKAPRCFEYYVPDDPLPAVRAYSRYVTTWLRTEFMRRRPAPVAE